MDTDARPLIAVPDPEQSRPEKSAPMRPGRSRKTRSDSGSTADADGANARMHSTKECNNDEARMTNVEEASEDSVHMFVLRSFNLPSSFGIRHSSFSRYVSRSEKNSVHLSTCPALRD